MNWLYDTNENNTARFTLGEYKDYSSKTLICFVINPSTSTPEKFDNTVKKIKTLSQNNNHKNWIVLNIYPQRATNPNDLHILADNFLHEKNIEYIKNILLNFNNSNILLTFGNLIEKRKYLLLLFKDIIKQIKTTNRQGKLLCIKLTKKGYPVHPLYQSSKAKFKTYDI